VPGEKEINAYLTPNWYHSAVRIIEQQQGQFRTGESAGIWLAFFLAAGLHAIMLLLPVFEKDPLAPVHLTPVRIELTTVQPPPSVVTEPEPETEATPPEPVSEPLPEILPEPPENPPQRQAETEPPKPLPEPTVTELPTRRLQRDLDGMSELEKNVLTSTILARQFITEESAVDRLFGKPLVQEGNDLQKDFHYPLRPDLIEMLDRPLPDLPFAYTPDLVYFAYDPGVKGDLQRFWDVITPEFGWRTKYGTEVKCGLILIIIGCAWK
jgi:hypothetical protein